MDRRNFLKLSGRIVAGTTLGCIGTTLAKRLVLDAKVYQIDPEACVQCGKCATSCVKPQSAVKCVNNWEDCGYCDYCFGYFLTDKTHDLSAKNKVCPVDAIERKLVAEGEYEYKINHKKCIGCGRCVARCQKLGNGTMHLQIQRDLCLECNQCNIAPVCVGVAIKKQPLRKKKIV